MTHRSTRLVACALVALTACFLKGACSWAKKTDTHKQDLAAIKELNRQDIAKTLSGNQLAMAELCTDDVVGLGQGEEPVIGKQALREVYKRAKAAHPEGRVLSYVPEIKDVTFADGWAIEWATFTGSWVDAPGGEVKRTRGKLLRVYKKENGAWKLARAMWNTSEQGADVPH